MALGLSFCACAFGAIWAGDAKLAGILGAFSAVGVVIVLAWVSWVTTRTHVCIDGRAKFVEVRRRWLGFRLVRRLPITVDTAIGLRLSSITNGTPRYSVVIGTKFNVIEFGSVLARDVKEQLVYRVRAIIGMPRDADLYFNVAAHEIGQNAAKKEPAETFQSPLDSAIQLIDYSDDQVTIRWPMVEPWWGKAIAAALLLAGGLLAQSCISTITAWFIDQPVMPADLSVVLFAIAGAALALVGLAAVFVSCELRLRPEAVRYSYRIGPFRWSRTEMSLAALVNAMHSSDDVTARLENLSSVQRGVFRLDRHGVNANDETAHLDAFVCQASWAGATRRELGFLLHDIAREEPWRSVIKPRRISHQSI